VLRGTARKPLTPDGSHLTAGNFGQPAGAASSSLSHKKTDVSSGRPRFPGALPRTLTLQ